MDMMQNPDKEPVMGKFIRHISFVRKIDEIFGIPEINQ